MIKKLISDTYNNSGHYSLALFWIAIVSGILLITLFDISSPVKSMAFIQANNPYALFIHSLHYWSAQLCIIATVIHVFAKIKPKVSPKVWMIASTGIPLLFLVMITGYIIKGDQHGELASHILINSIKYVPGINFIFTRFMIMPENTLLSFYIYHVSILTFGSLFTIYLHSKKLFTTLPLMHRSILITTTISFFLPPVLIYSDSDIPRAPWYLLSLQEYLHLAPHPIFVILMGISIFLFLLFIYRIPRKYSKYFLLSFFAVYTLTLVFVLLFRSYQWQINANESIMTKKSFLSPTHYFK